MLRVKWAILVGFNEGMSGRFGDLGQCLMSNVNKRPLVFFHCVNRNLLSTFFRLT